MQCRRFLFAALSFPLGLGSAGCAFAPAAPLQVWAVGDSMRVFVDGEPPVQTDVFDPHANRITLDAAVNEVVAFQLVLRSGVGVVEGVRVSVGDLTSEAGTIRGGDAFALFREHVVPIRQYPAWFLRYSPLPPTPREYFDALVPFDAPRGGQPFAIPPERNVVVWVDLHVPPGTPPGTYQSILQIVARNAPPRTVNIELRVRPIALPGVPDLAVLAAVDHEALFAHHLLQEGTPYVPERFTPEVPQSGAARSLVTETFRMLHAHRLSPYLHRMYPVVKVAADQSLEVDWDDYDTLVADFLDGTAFADRVPVAAWPLPIDGMHPPPPDAVGGSMTRYAENVADYLRQCMQHFQERGWHDRHFIAYDPDFDTARRDPPTVVPSQDEFMFARRIHAAEVGGRYVAPFPPQDMTQYGWYGTPPLGWSGDANLVSIFCPSARWYDAIEMSEHRQTGRATWFVPDAPPCSGSLSIAADFVQARGLPWVADRFGAEAMLLPGVNTWGPPPFDWTRAESGTSGDKWLLYPGSVAGLDRPIPSIRLKQLRRGMYDRAYLQLLRQRGHDAVADRIARALVKRVGVHAYGEHVHDTGPLGWAGAPHLWRLARHLSAEVLAEQRNPDDDVALIAARVGWARYFDETETLDLQVEGVRIVPTPSGELEVNVHVVIVNDRDRPVSGQMRFGALDDGWTTAVPKWALVGLEPRHARRMTLTARARALAGNRWGIAELPIELLVDGEPPIRVTARLAQLAVRRLDRPITIDGDLRDWPPGLGNVAGDFLRLRSTAAAAEADPLRRDVPTTIAFVCRDDVNLYVAMNCMDIGGDRPDSATSNVVRYDRSMPAHDDLVELVLDPTNGGTGSTGDLYHIVVKANGAALAERGIGWSPSTGPRSVWPVAFEAAVSQPRAGQWDVELSIPLSSFDEGQFASPVWGIEFARFAKSRRAYVTWTGARRNAYAPRGLGNMVW